MASNIFPELKPELFGEKADDVDASLKSLERTIPLSDSYRQVLLTFGGAIYFYKIVVFKSDEPSPLNDKDGYQALDILYGLGNGENSIEQKIEQYEGELPPSFAPIGEAPGGNLICMNDAGAVYLWDHESPRGGKEVWRIAESMDDFLGRLKLDNSPPVNTDGIIESESWLDI